MAGALNCMAVWVVAEWDPFHDRWWSKCCTGGRGEGCISCPPTLFKSPDKEYTSLSPLELSASTGTLRKALRSGCTLEVGARMVMGKSIVGDVSVADMSLIMNRKKVADVA